MRANRSLSFNSSRNLRNLNGRRINLRSHEPFKKTHHLLTLCSHLIHLLLKRRNTRFSSRLSKTFESFPIRTNSFHSSSFRFNVASWSTSFSNLHLDIWRKSIRKSLSCKNITWRKSQLFSLNLGRLESINTDLNSFLRSLLDVQVLFTRMKLLIFIDVGI